MPEQIQITPEQQAKLSAWLSSLSQSGWLKWLVAAAALVAGGAVAGYYAGQRQELPSGDLIDAVNGVRVDVRALNTNIATADANSQKGFAELKLLVVSPPAPNPNDPPAPAPTPANPVVLPAELKADVGRMTKLSGKATGEITWLIPPESVAYADAYVVGPVVLITPLKDGTFSIGAVTIAEGKVSSPAWTRIVAGKGPQPPPIPPVPDPPKPEPPKPPLPPTPIPEAGFRVMIIEDKEKLSTLPPAQLSIRTSKIFRDFLEASCVTEPDGKTKGYRIWDHKVNPVADLKVWQDAFARSRTSLPWLIVSDGKSGYEGPLPANVDETITLLKKIKGS